MAFSLAKTLLRGGRALQISIAGLGLFLAGECFAQTSDPLDKKFQEAERLFWLDNWVAARELFSTCEAAYATSNPARAMLCKFSRLRADAEAKTSYAVVSETIDEDLKSDVALNHPEVRLRGLVVKATADLSINDPALSGQEWREVKSLAEALGLKGWAERAVCELSIVAYLQGDAAHAILFNNQAFEKAKQLGDVAGMIRALSLKGVGILELNAPDHAVPLFDQALDLAQKQPDVRFPLMAYMGKAQALERLGNDKESLILLQQAKQFVEKIGMNVYMADLSIALGERAIKRGLLKEAEQDFEEAEQFAARAKMPRPRAAALMHLIELESKAGDWLKARALIRPALEADRQLIDMQFYPKHLTLAAQIESHLGHTKQAEAYLLQASDVIEAAMANVPSESVKISLISTMSEVYSAHFKLALEGEKNLPRAFSALEASRGRVIAVHLRSANTQTGRSDPRTAALKRRISEIQLALLSSKNASERQRLLRQLTDVEFQLEPLLITNEMKQGSMKSRPISLPGLQAQLTEDEVLLEYVLGDERSFCLAITRQSAKAYALPGQQTVQLAVKAYTDEVSSSTPMKESLRIKARALYEQVLGPVAELSSKHNLIIIPDGALHGVGFDSLITERQEYLLRSHTISYVPSASVLMELRARPAISAPNLLVAFGAPVLPTRKAEKPSDARSGPLDLLASELGDLKAAAGEVRQIAADLGGNVKVFVGADATEGVLKREVSSAVQIVHLATHGFADMSHGDRSAILLSPDGKTGDDGLFQIREIRGMHLRTNLVVLSACDAGIGRSDGIEGVESLVNAFIFAGARTVLASRWKANDQFSANLMDQTYKGIHDGLDIPHALRRAQLKLLADFGDQARPIYWSAFFVSGAPDTKLYVQLPQSASR